MEHLEAPFQDQLFPTPELTRKVFEFDILNTPEMRAEYLSLTDSLVKNIVEQGTDIAIFLDKSARPIAWMLKEFWPQLVPPADAEGNQAQLPEIKFLNIDREQWGAILGRSVDDASFNVKLLPQERADELRSIFEPVKGRGPEDVDSMLAGKKVLIIDEVKVSGETLDIAEKIIMNVFPEAEEFRVTHWMDGGVKVDPESGQKIHTREPVWYSDREVTGRLVNDRDTARSSRSPSVRQRTGRYWLSTTFRQRDEKGLKLKAEIGLMAEELARHELPYMPALWSDDTDSVVKRIERINGITIEEYVGLKQSTRDIASFVQSYKEYMRDRHVGLGA